MAGRTRQQPAEDETRVARLQRAFANHKVGALILVVVAVLGALGTAIEGGRAVAGLFGGEESAPTPEPREQVRFEQGELAPVTNARFAFAFRHPTTWEREGAVNADGAVFRAPEEAVELVAYGVNAHEGPDDLLERVDYLAAREKRYVLDAGGEILDDSLRIGPWAGAGDELPAQRLVYRARDEDSGRPVTSVAVLTSQGGRDVTIRCQAPTARFDAYAGACNQLVATLRIERLPG